MSRPGVDAASTRGRTRASRILPALAVTGSLLLAGNAGLVGREQAATATRVDAPEAFFGFRMGTDGRLAGWEALERYFRTVADRSDRVELVEIGPTTGGRTLIAALITTPRNVARLPAIQETNRRLADPRLVDPAEAEALRADQPVIVAVGASIHASEVGATQMASELLFELATTTDEAMLDVLDRVLLILIPSLNPDGHELVVDWFVSQQGTGFEASPMPWLYHEYVGHDINRDAFMMNMAESRSLAAFFYGRWHPQVFLTMHQMGQRGPRFFVPPTYDPVDPNVDPLIWRAASLLGQAMALELEQDGHSGVISSALFDYYWPGYEDSAPLGHNTVGLLTEAASARLALPATIDAADLSGTPRGLPVYAPQVNFPNPWPGGTWRLRDIVDYDLSAVHGLLLAASRYRDELLENFVTMGRRAIEQGTEGDPFAFVIPSEQHDPLAAAKLIDLLSAGGVEVQNTLEPFRIADTVYPEGTHLVLMAQPFRAYAKTLLERQTYPVRRLAPDAPPERPYDVAGWTLPLQMGVRVDTIPQYFEPPASTRVTGATIAPGRVWGDPRPSFYVSDSRGNGGATLVNRLLAAGLEPSWLLEPLDVQGRTYPSGSVLVEHSDESRTIVERAATDLGIESAGVRGGRPDARDIGAARTGLYKPWVASIDEGWTRWLLEQHEFPFVPVEPAEVRTGALPQMVDVLILPDADPERLLTGYEAGEVPAQYAGGLGAEGVSSLASFVQGGGTIVCLDSSCDLVIDALDLPVRNLVRDLEPAEFFCPGSILGLELDASHPLAFGMTPSTTALFAFSAAYELETPASDSPGTVAARYAAQPVLLSGWLEGEEHIAGRPAVVDLQAGEGRVVLIGFRAQHRGQSLATFRLLFNAILSWTPGD